MVSNQASGPSHRTFRRQFLRAATGTAASVGGLVGTSAARSSTAGERSDRGQASRRNARRRGTAEGDDAVAAAVERFALPLAVEDGSVCLRDLVPAATRLVDGPVLGAAARADERAAETVIAGALSEYPIVGMGEATHATYEFDAIRRRLIQRLVADHGLRAVAFEDQFSAGVAANDYVVHGEGDVSDALASFPIWIWRSEEIRRLLEWLREFNRGRPRGDRVEVYGLDGQFPEPPARALVDFLERADPEALGSVEDVLPSLADWSSPGFVRYEADGGRSLREENVAAARDAVETIRERLQNRRDAIVAATSEREWLLATRHLRTLEQSAAFWEASLGNPEQGSGQELRDGFLAENATWIQETLAEGQLAFWAHNVHVRRGTTYGQLRSMGDVLAETHGDDYYPLALSFARGSFRTFVIEERQRGVLELEEPNAETPALLADVEYPQFFLDFDVARSDPTLSEWLDGDHELHFVGADDSHAGRADPVDLADAFDGLLFVRDATASTIVDLSESDDAEADGES